jgi:MFS superfamily sulfate permease-like transporter
MHGPLFFAAAEKIKSTLLPHKPKVLVLSLIHVTTIDATGLRTLHEIAAQCAREGTQLILVATTLKEVLERSHFQLALTLDEALHLAAKGLDTRQSPVPIG